MREPPSDMARTGAFVVSGGGWERELRAGPARAEARARRGRRRCRSAVACRVHPVAALRGAGADRFCGPGGRDGSGDARAPPQPRHRRLADQRPQDRRLRVSAGGRAGRGAGLLAHDLRPDAAGRTAGREGPLDATAGEAFPPGLGSMAILRILGTLDEAGLSNETAEAVARKLMDPAEVRVSRQFPLRFISAAREVRSLRWAWPLERALQLSLDNIPELNGRT